MTTAATKSKPAWQAEVAWGKRYCTTTEITPPDGTDEAAEGTVVETLHSARVCYVDVFRPDGERIRFVVNHREGRRLSFTDPRERSTGAAGTTGLWGTWPGQKAGQPRSLTPTAFRMEVTPLIGSERAMEIIQTLLSPDFFVTVSDICKS